MFRSLSFRSVWSLSGSPPKTLPDTYAMDAETKSVWFTQCPIFFLPFVCIQLWTSVSLLTEEWPLSRTYFVRLQNSVNTTSRWPNATLSLILLPPWDIGVSPDLTLRPLSPKCAACFTLERVAHVFVCNVNGSHCPTHALILHANQF